MRGDEPSTLEETRTERFVSPACAGMSQRAVSGQPIRLITPLMHSSKAEIIQLGHRLGLDYAMTVSCYQATDDGAACGRCDSCRLRKAGFNQAGVPDPTRYAG